jgi:phosphoserine phosphatase
MAFIVSDIEGTLTTGSSWKALRTYYKTHFNPRTYDWFFIRWIPRYFLVSLGLLSRRKAMFDWMQEEVQLFKGFSHYEFNQMADWVVENEMWPKRRLDVLAEIEHDRQDGVQVLAVSSAYLPIVEAFSRKIGAMPIGTPVRFVDGRLKGIELPINAYEYKAQAVLHLIGDTNQGETHILSAYGDTISDLPMMELSRSPVAVYPNSALKQIAESRGWQVIETKNEN